ncbi:MAG: hypothetical protein Kow0074_01750 [Candidatus Zixiibacteriota bacterium]
MAYRRLDQILKAKGRVTDAQITKALRQQSLFGGRLGEHLLINGDVGETELIEALSEQLHVRGVAVGQRPIDPGLFKILPRHVAEQNLCLPISYDADSNVLNVAFADPLDRDCVRAVERSIQPVRLRPLVGLATHIHAALIQTRCDGNDPTASPLTEETSSEIHPVSKLRGCLELLELAVSICHSTESPNYERHIDPTRLIREVSGCMGLNESDIENLRLASVALAVAEHTTPHVTDDLQLASTAASLLRTVGLPQAALILEKLVRAQRGSGPADDVTQILMVCHELALELGGHDITADGLASWRDDYLSRQGNRFKTDILDHAIAILLGRHGQERLLSPAAELLLVGDSDLSGSVYRAARAHGMRVVRNANVTEAIASSQRRRPDIVCVIDPNGAKAQKTNWHGELTRFSVDPNAILVVSTSPYPEQTVVGPDNWLHSGDGDIDSNTVVGHLLELLKRTRQTNASSRPTPEMTRSEAVMSGRLSDLPPADLIQVLCSTQKTVRVDCVDEQQKATLWFHAGQIIRAESTVGVAEMAFYHLVGWTKGHFEVHHLEDIPGTNICTSTTALLLEALRRIDEQHRPAQASHT